MRLYFFGNFYLSSIQQGIQAAHVTAELFTKYGSDQYQNQPLCDLCDWAEHHKTMILLNGGMASDLWNIDLLLRNNDNPFAWATFCEEEAALNNSITSVGIVLPEYIYAGASEMRNLRWDLEQLSDNGGVMTITYEGKEQARRYTRWEAKLMEIMNGCRLAS